MAEAAAAAELYLGWVAGSVRRGRGRDREVGRRGGERAAEGEPVPSLPALRRVPENPGPPGPVPPTGVSFPASSMYLPPPPTPPGMYRSFLCSGSVTGTLCLPGRCCVGRLGVVLTVAITFAHRDREVLSQRVVVTTGMLQRQGQPQRAYLGHGEASLLRFAIGGGDAMKQCNIVEMVKLAIALLNMPPMAKRRGLWTSPRQAFVKREPWP